MLIHRLGEVHSVRVLLMVNSGLDQYFQKAAFLLLDDERETDIHIESKQPRLGTYYVLDIC